MQTKFVTVEVSLRASEGQLREAIANSELLRSDALRSRIETALFEQGTPLRWAIASIDVDQQSAQVEAIVTTMA